MKIYAGIGSRSCPQEILDKITFIAEKLGANGWLLRSGGADGADKAFETGCDNVNGQKEIFIPWPGFNGSKSLLNTPNKDAFILASTIHPAWDNLSHGGKKLHARNCYQVLSSDLLTPANLIICYTLNGKDIGGTRTAIVLARKYNIKIINLAIEEFDFSQFIEV